jgi:phage tail sheath protein FI
MAYQRPGVYVREIALLPPSVAEVSTAIPAFIGFTETKPEDATENVVIRRITSMKEYEKLFGGPDIPAFDVTIVHENISIAENTNNHNCFVLYYQLEMFFKNGGGPCYIVSVGRWKNGFKKANDFIIDAFDNGIDALQMEDEPTLILLTDAIHLSKDHYYSLCNQVLMHCGKMKDRFAIFDTMHSDNLGEDFRANGPSGEYLKYAAAYTPHLFTSMQQPFDETTVNCTIKTRGQKEVGGVIVLYNGNLHEENPPLPKVDVKENVDSNNPNDPPVPPFHVANETLTIHILASGDEYNKAANILVKWQKWKAENPDEVNGFDIIANPANNDELSELSNPESLSKETVVNLQALKASDTLLHSNIVSQLRQRKLTLPPSGAVAGVYARVDANRGVWKAPANVNVMEVIGPAVKLTDDEHDRLNIDATGGKSINAIRNYAGRGTLIMGARTLAGNDNEWRYVNVRRLFNMIEESTQKATQVFVFEPNNATTWLKVQGMIESYLFGLWQRGALAGPTPESAYFVEVGLGKTMTQDNILNGLMIVEIGIAAVRPAEFIILRFSHKMQEA